MLEKIGKDDETRPADGDSETSGPVIDPGDYASDVPAREVVDSLAELSPSMGDRSAAVGVDVTEACRSGSYFQVDHSLVYSASGQAGLEVMGLAEALARHGWLEEYRWKLLPRDMDRYTASVGTSPHGGYFIRSLAGARATFPLQACLYMTREGMVQNVHNIIIAEEGSDLSVITGCTTGPSVRSGLHIGVSEFYVKRGARLTFTMLHNWAEGMAVRPRSAALLEEGAVFVSNYICIAPVMDLQMCPRALCAGKGSVARFSNVLMAPPGCRLDVGSSVFLRAEESRAEVLSRAVTTGGHIAARGLLVGEVPGVKAHMDCRGLILSPEGTIRAVPELRGDARDVDMSHEAAVGRIAEDEILYLMSRGLTEEEAVSAIVRGFLDVQIKGLPGRLRDDVERVIAEVAGRGEI
ncbi:MAG: SufD family Fe-S cluster assembly protein [bacterium]|nr:MAG: SufD family Fe-S cluster assembly protein [bacterium]